MHYFFKLEEIENLTWILNANSKPRFDFTSSAGAAATFFINFQIEARHGDAKKTPHQ
jgi:hypothetical protein